MADATMTGTNLFMTAIVALGTQGVSTESGKEIVRIAIGLLAMSLGNPKIREKMWKSATKNWARTRKSKGSVKLVRNQAEPCPVPYSAVMHFIETHDCGVKELKVISAAATMTDSFNPYASTRPVAKKPSLYSVAQESTFKLTRDIYATYKSNRITYLGKDTDIDTLLLMSDTLSPKGIIAFIKKCEDALDMHLKNTINTQSIIDISWNSNKGAYSSSHELNFVATVSPWSSCASFDNRFFENKAEIMESVDKFCSNKAWYAKMGIPHSLGILLWGAPGCGKTSFIKALANHASFRDKHILNIRLSKNFDLDVLGRILASEYITTDIFVPLDKRILVFEDIDCMADVVMDRSSPLAFASTVSMIKGAGVDSSPKNNNSLNTLLNILDGLNEAADRVIIMTSNHPEKLDKALTRSGRIDINMEFKKASCKEIEEIVYHFWELTEPLTFIVPEDWTRALSAADVVNICRSCKCVGDVCDAMGARIEADRERERLEQERKDKEEQDKQEKEQKAAMKAAMTSAAATAATIEILKATQKNGSEPMPEDDVNRDARCAEEARESAIRRSETDTQMDNFIKSLPPIDVFSVFPLSD
jgi:ATPase family associated with various cellular activities (AAA)